MLDFLVTIDPQWICAPPLDRARGSFIALGCSVLAPRAELYVNGEKSRALFLTFCTVAICMKIKNTKIIPTN